MQNINYQTFYENYTKIHNVDRWYDIKFNDVLHRINEYHSKNLIYGNILEIGVFLGLSFLPLSFLNKKNELVVGIDTFENYGRIVDTETKFIHNLLQVRKTIDRIIIIKDQSNKIDYRNLEFNLLQYRIISIDGDHSYENTLHDLNLSRKLLHPQGIIIIDDYENKSWPDVKLAVNFFLEENKEFEINKQFIINNKTIVFRKDNNCLTL